MNSHLDDRTPLHAMIRFLNPDHAPLGCGVEVVRGPRCWRLQRLLGRSRMGSRSPSLSPTRRTRGRGRPPFRLPPQSGPPPSSPNPQSAPHHPPHTISRPPPRMPDPDSPLHRIHPDTAPQPLASHKTKLYIGGRSMRTAHWSRNTSHRAITRLFSLAPPQEQRETQSRSLHSPKVATRPPRPHGRWAASYALCMQGMRWVSRFQKSQPAPSRRARATPPRSLSQ